MKSIILLFALSVTAVAQAQFTGKNGDEVTSCDCADPINHLDYTLTLPGNYRQYDVIQFVAYRGDLALSVRTIRPSELLNAKVTLSVLNSANKALRTLFGREYGRYRGNDFTRASYSSLCETESGSPTLQIVTFGYTQIGTEVTYELDASKTKVIGKSVEIYDNGVELHRSEKISFKKML